MIITLEGKLDALTSASLEEELDVNMDGITSLIFDLEKLNYISSAGLRILLASKRKMEHQGAMIVRKPTKTVMDVFEVTGFNDILDIEEPSAERESE